MKDAIKKQSCKKRALQERAPDTKNVQIRHEDTFIGLKEAMKRKSQNQEVSVKE